MKARKYIVVYPLNTHCFAPHLQFHVNVQASLKALQVLLERTTPSANSLIRRLPADVPPHSHVSLLVDYIRNSEAHSTSRGFGTTQDSVQSSSQFPGAPSGMSGDLRTSEVLFALDSASGPAPQGPLSFQHSDGGATLSDHNTMTDSVALSAAAPSALMSGATHRMSASQIPENDEIVDLDQPIPAGSSMPGKAVRPYSTESSTSAQVLYPTSLGASNQHVRIGSADGDLLRPVLWSQTSETNDLRQGPNSMGSGYPLGSGSMHDVHAPVAPTSMTVTDGPSSMPMSQINESPKREAVASGAQKAPGAPSSTNTVDSAAVSAVGNAGSFTTQTSGYTMAPHLSGQSLPAIPQPNLSSFMPSTADTFRGLIPSLNGTYSSVPATASEASMLQPVSQGPMPRQSSAGSLQVLSLCLL